MLTKLKKLVAMIVLSIVLNSFLALPTYAEATTGTPFGDPESDSIPFCLDPDNPKYGAKLTHILEEPILQPSGTAIGGKNGEPLCYKQDGNDDFLTCICYRNTFSIREADGNKRLNSTELLSECSTEASTLLEQEIALDEGRKDNEKLDPRFGCQEVQVLLCSGGTCLINSYIGSIYRWAATVVGLIAVLVIIVSAIQLSVSGGDQSAVDDAKRRIIQSISGIAVLFLSGVILNAINPNFFTFG